MNTIKNYYVKNACKKSDYFCREWIRLDQILRATLPFPLQFILVHSEPGVRDFLAAAREASPPADAMPAGEAASADRLALLGPSLGGGVFPRHIAGELFQGIHS